MCRLKPEEPVSVCDTSEEIQFRRKCGLNSLEANFLKVFEGWIIKLGLSEVRSSESPGGTTITIP